MKLHEVAAILGCSKPAASLLRNGKYDRDSSELPARYALLKTVLERGIAERSTLNADQICYACPRQDCSGCRVAEIKD